MGWLELLKRVAAMIAFDTLFAVMTVLVKKALDGVLNPVVLIALRQLLGAAFLAMIAYFKESSNSGSKTRFTKEIFAYLFMSALLGALFAQNLFFLGLSYTTATLTAAVSNMTLVFTFLIAVPLRSETVDVRSKASLAKIRRTLVSFGGAVLLSLYKGAGRAALTHTACSAHENGTTSTSSSKWFRGSGSIGDRICADDPEQRGPVFTAGFCLIQIIAGVLDLLVLHEQLYVGRKCGRCCSCQLRPLSSLREEQGSIVSCCFIRERTRRR